MHGSSFQPAAHYFRSSLTLSLLILAVSVGGCGNSHDTGSRSSRTDWSASSTSTPDQVTRVPSQEELVRGFPVAGFTCPSSFNPGNSVQVPTSAVTGLLLCAPETLNQQQQALTITSTKRVFRVLLRALAAPDAPRSSGPCPALSVVSAPILARTAALVLLVKVPVDGCGLQQDNVGTAINEARAG